MNISLRPITAANWRAAHKLTKSLSPEQQTFVAPNTYSILEAMYEPDVLFPLAIYDGETMVGFAMYGFEGEPLRWWIVRFMIGAEYQGKGYGRAAMLALIELLKQQPNCDAIYLSFVPANETARKLYASLGFEDTGEVEDDEIIYRLPVTRAPDAPQEQP